VLDRVPKEGLKTDNDTHAININTVSLAAVLQPLVGRQKHDVFEVFVCQLGAFVGHSQARVEVIRDLLRYRRSVKDD